MHSGITTKKKGRRKAAKVKAAATAAVGVTATASLQQSEGKKRGRPARLSKSPPPPASVAASASVSESELPLGASILSLLSPESAVSVSSSLTSSSATSKRKVGRTNTVTTNDYTDSSTPSKFLCLESEELKVGLASVLDVRAENLVETLSSLLNKLNNTGRQTDDSSQSEAATASAVPAAPTVLYNLSLIHI